MKTILKPALFYFIIIGLFPVWLMIYGAICMSIFGVGATSPLNVVAYPLIALLIYLSAVFLIYFRKKEKKYLIAILILSIASILLYLKDPL